MARLAGRSSLIMRVGVDELFDPAYGKRYTSPSLSPFSSLRSEWEKGSVAAYGRMNPTSNGVISFYSLDVNAGIEEENSSTQTRFK